MMRPSPWRAGVAPRGFTLVELLITLALAALLLAAAVPSVGKWMANARVRSAAEVLQNGLRAAQQEAVRRSRRTVFALTTAAPDLGVTPVANGSNWYVRAQPLTGSSETASLVTRHQALAGTGVTVTGPALLCFNSQGQLLGLAAADTGLNTACGTANPVSYTVGHAQAERSLKVLVYLGGRVLMCDSAKTWSASQPDGCPA